MLCDARTAVAMSFVIKDGRDERAARIAPAPEPARAGREPAARLAELVSEPVRCGGGSGLDSCASVRAFFAAAVESARSCPTGSVAGFQTEVARRRRGPARARGRPPPAAAPPRGGTKR